MHIPARRTAAIVAATTAAESLGYDSLQAALTDMLAKQISRKQMARRLGVCPATVYEWLTREPPTERIVPQPRPVDSWQPYPRQVPMRTNPWRCHDDEDDAPKPSVWLEYDPHGQEWRTRGPGAASYGIGGV